MEVNKLYNCIYCDDPKNEIWLSIKGYEGYYEISSFGKVKSLKRMINCKNYLTDKILLKERILKYNIKKAGYCEYIFSKDNTPSYFLAHLLVWDHFSMIPRNGRIAQVDHKDTIKTHNCFYNLQLLTAQNNTLKMYYDRKKHTV